MCCIHPAFPGNPRRSMTSHVTCADGFGWLSNSCHLPSCRHRGQNQFKLAKCLTPHCFFLQTAPPLTTDLTATQRVFDGGDIQSSRSWWSCHSLVVRQTSRQSTVGGKPFDQKATISETHTICLSVRLPVSWLVCL